MKNIIAVAAAAGMVLGTAHTRADEGMWLVNKPPLKLLKERYNIEPTREWLTHMQRSAVRFQTGGSGSIVSRHGLVMTNHHVGADMLEKLSTKDHNLLETGFWAKTQADEPKCPDLELNVLWDIQDVTDTVQQSVKPGMTSADSGSARRKAIAEIESDAKTRTGMKAQVVTLYQGGQYHLYLYKAYTDIRLVFAPEQAIAFFGGDADNFEFPRYNLDCCFFRIYENDKPIDAQDWLAWSPNGAQENEPVFIFGHPGRTRRGYTVDHLRFLRDIQLPETLANLFRREVRYQGFAGRGAEQSREVHEDLDGVANSRKAYMGILAGLQDPVLFNSKIAQENELRSAVDADATQEKQWGGAWEAIKQAEKTQAATYIERETLNRFNNSGLCKRALQIVQLAAELPKPSGERLSDYGDAKLDSLYLNLYSPEPLYDDLEIEQLTQALSLVAEKLGGEAALTTTLLAGKSPAARATELVKGSRLKQVDARKSLVSGGAKAVDASQDPLVRFATLLDPRVRELRRIFEDRVDAVERENYSKIAAAKFAKFGDAMYPDATFTLRMAFGTVKGIAQDNVPPFTNIAGTFTRAEERKGQPDFDLPKSWWDARPKFNSATPFNFICTADIIGGNSGSPVVNAKGEVVGLVFDGNVYSLVGDVGFDTVNARAVAVDSRGLVESLRVVYHADGLVNELTGK